MIFYYRKIFCSNKTRETNFVHRSYFSGNRGPELNKVTYSNSVEYFTSDEIGRKSSFVFFLHGEFNKSIEILNKLLLKSNDIAFKSFVIIG